MRHAASLIAAVARSPLAQRRRRGAAVGGCPVFPPDNPWNQRVDRLPVQRNSDAIVRSIGLGDTMHADFGSGLWDGGPIGIPFVTVGGAPAQGARVASTTPTSRIAAAIRSRPRVPIEGGPQRGRRPSRDRRRPQALPALRAVRRLPATAAQLDAPARARSGTCAPTGCARAAGPRRTPPACRSCPGWPATTRSSAAGSTTRCASRPSARAARSSTRPGTSPPT